MAASDHKAVIIFEGRDVTGKGGLIKRITQRLNPRICRVARTQWYFQRYVSHLPAAGEIVLFDRSWYNCAGIERAMGICNDEQYEEFFHSVPTLKEFWCAQAFKSSNIGFQSLTKNSIYSV